MKDTQLANQRNYNENLWDGGCHKSLCHSQKDKPKTTPRKRAPTHNLITTQLLFASNHTRRPTNELSQPRSHKTILGCQEPAEPTQETLQRLGLQA